MRANIGWLHRQDLFAGPLWVILTDTWRTKVRQTRYTILIDGQKEAFIWLGCPSQIFIIILETKKMLIKIVLQSWCVVGPKKIFFQSLSLTCVLFKKII